LGRTRILLAGLPRLLQEIVTDALKGEEEVEVVGVVDLAEDLARTARSTEATVVILGDDDPSVVVSLLERQPRLGVLAVGADARESWLYALRPERVRLGDLSPRSLVSAVRDAAQPGAQEWWSR
jgi:DNA-binding NarL/FixJ family response regulator